MIEISLSKGFCTQIDDIDADLKEARWHVSLTKSNVYVSRNCKKENGLIRQELLHRTILERVLDRKLQRNEWVDHIDGNSLNNQRSNLRLATPSQNRANSKKRSNNKSGYKGVFWHKKYQKWYSKIRVNGAQIFLGNFPTAQEAYRAYCEAARMYFGEFARFD